MKRLLLLAVGSLGLFLGASSCNPSNVIEITVYAQTGFPVNKTLIWNAPTADATHGLPDSYSVTQNATVIGTPAGTATSQAITFPSAGDYTFVLTAINSFGQAASTPLLIHAKPPAGPTGLGIQ